MTTFILFIIVFGGMVFVHELGHFLAARLFDIPVDEFGFGIPPRALRFWRSKGSVIVDGQHIVVPTNFEFPFERENALRKAVLATADRVNDRLVLRTIELVKAEEQPQAVEYSGHALNVDGRPLVVAFPAEKKPAPQAGAVKIEGLAAEINPGTEFTLNWLPFGGFVRPRGENDPGVPDGMAAANPWKRLGVLVAGPLMNLLTAIIVFGIIVAQAGVAIPGKVLIQDVTAGSPAEQAGLKSQDLIVAINGTTVTEIDPARTLIRASLDKPMTMTIERGGQTLSLSATPLSSRTAEQGALGVALTYPHRPAGLGDALTGGVELTGAQALNILYIPVGLIQGVIAPQDARLVGLKGIYDFLGSAVQKDTQSRQEAAQTPISGSQPAPQPTNYVLLLIGMLSVSLGVFNLLPIPALDGGRILFTLPELLFRRRIPTRFENTVNGVAMLLLISLMLVVNLMDFINPVNIKLP
jgi:regulator of sigma E protease